MAATSTTTFSTTFSSIDTSAPSSVFNINLLINGDAETGPCGTTDAITPPTNWDYSGTVFQIFYNSIDGTLTPSSLGPN
ncbi:unnamed protein product [Rotaria sp. Silwood2]|nr:unnamed protein product [Rotaria sp. Silwood2]CAF4219158.1 unnamed protein product [Rotaria sp. Silwood2]